MKSSTPGRGDHPRIRGEHGTSKFSDIFVKGSSPHTRGARRPAGHPPRAGRIIPAYAGSTDINCITVEEMKDHPRIRGEHYDVTLTPNREEGSSPHTRGAHLKLTPRVVDVGIIPAYAGSTSL